MGWIVALCLVISTSAWGHTIEGRIVGVHDGDTITLLDAENRQHKIRLDGVDAPELGQPFGRTSKQHLAELLFNGMAVAECSKIDRYRREVCRVLVGGTDAGLEQIRAGMAWYFRRYAKELPPDRRQQYANIEAQAKGERRGPRCDPGWAVEDSYVPPSGWVGRNGGSAGGLMAGSRTGRLAAACDSSETSYAHCNPLRSRRSRGTCSAHIRRRARQR